MTSFFICASARTGTNVLATALRATGVAGRPLEYFSRQLAQGPFMLRMLGLAAAEDGAPDFVARLPAILRAGRTPNGIFGTTVHCVQLENVMAAIGGSIGRPSLLPSAAESAAAVAALRNVFPDLRFIWLRRENCVAQAISHYRAIRSGRWSEAAREPAPAEPVDIPYNGAEILRLTQGAERDASFWARFLAGAEETTLPLTYEQLAADFPETVRRVLDFLGLPAAEIDIPPPVYRRQADATSLDWEARFRRERADHDDPISG
jgi:LPS sulfotransferase NodH